ncbi:MAG: NAD(P)-binding domain-containing protein, partial [Chloroflexota bacterium]
GRYRVKTEAKTYQAKNVVIATGSFQKPKIPAFSANIPADVLQLHSGKYRNPRQLPDGAILVVGSAQSGMQIAEELYQSGRKVYLSTGFAPRAPRRYRGRDVFAWLVDAGFFEQTPDKLSSLKARFGANLQLSGKDGGHNLNLHQFARDGVTLLGHIADAQNGKVTFKPDLKAANITSIIWAMGYTFGYGLVKLPVTDEDSFPIQKRGVTQYPGLYFVGINWLSTRKSTLLLAGRERRCGVHCCGYDEINREKFGKAWLCAG